MSIRLRLFGLVAAALVIAGVAAFFVVQDVYVGTAQHLAQTRLTAAAQTFKSLERAHLEKLASAAGAVASDPEFKKALESQDRVRLLKMSEATYTRLHTHNGISHWYFEQKPEDGGAVVLRVHRPDKYGDVIQRDTYRQAVATGRGQGLELGKTAFALRHVEPVNGANGAPVGYIEMGEEINTFLRSLKIADGGEYSLVVMKSALPPGSEESWEEIRAVYPNAGDWSQRSDTLLVDSTNSKPYVWEGSPGDLDESGRIAATRVDGERVFVDGAFPVSDAEGRVIGAVSVTRDVTDIYDDMRKAQLEILAYVGAVMGILGVLLVISLNRAVFGPLRNARERLDILGERLDSGDAAVRYDPKNSGPDEVAELEKALERFVKSVVRALSTNDRRRGTP